MATNELHELLLATLHASNAGHAVARSSYINGSSNSDATTLQQEQQLQVTRKKRSRPPRKATYYMRKDEIHALQTELASLSAHLSTLTSERGLLANPHRIAPHLLQQLQTSLLQKQTENETLRTSIQRNSLVFAHVQSVFTAQATAGLAHLPFESHIRLGADWPQRHATLLALKAQKLRDGQQFVAQRTQHLDPSASHAEHTRFANANGDLCALRLDVVPFAGVQSVQRVFDALLFYLFNMEISVTEILGDITVREGEGARMHGVAQNRLVSNVFGDVEVEFNAATFCELVQADADTGRGSSESVGVVVANFVADDALFPYAPATRLRNDITAAMTVTLERSRSTSDCVVVVKRVASTRLRRTDLPIPSFVMQELQRRVEGWGDAMLKTVESILYPDVAVPMDS